jgi:hypothetical protein
MMRRDAGARDGPTGAVNGMENTHPNVAAAPRRKNPFQAEDRIAFPPVVPFSTPAWKLPSARARARSARRADARQAALTLNCAEPLRSLTGRSPGVPVRQGGAESGRRRL